MILRQFQFDLTSTGLLELSLAKMQSSMILKKSVKHFQFYFATYYNNIFLSVDQTTTIGHLLEVTPKIFLIFSTIF